MRKRMDLECLCWISLVLFLVGTIVCQNQLNLNSYFVTLDTHSNFIYSAFILITMPKPQFCDECGAEYDLQPGHLVPLCNSCRKYGSPNKKKD